MPRPPETEASLKARFLANIRRHPDGCWQWLGSSDRSGKHPKMQTSLRRGWVETLPATHVALYFARRSWPRRRVAHIDECWLSSCVNPAHLVETEALSRWVSKDGQPGRSNKLTAEAVAEIRKLWRAHVRHRQTLTGLARRFRVHPDTIGRIIKQ